MRNSTGKDSDLEFLPDGKKGTSAKIEHFRKTFALEKVDILAIRQNLGGNEKIIVAFFEAIKNIDNPHSKNSVFQHLIQGGEIFEKIRGEILTKKMTVETAILFLQTEPITISLPKSS